TLDAYNAAAGALSLHVGLVWWMIALLLAAGYFVLLFRLSRGKVAVGEESDHGQPLEHSQVLRVVSAPLMRGEEIMSGLDRNGRAQPGASVPHVVIVGGGFGGMNAASALRGAPVRVTLIDRQNSHVFRPMLYQVATGILP